MAPPANLAELEVELRRLRAEHPGAIIERYLDRLPHIAEDVLVCSGAAIVGDVRLATGASVWYGSVLRADMNYIEIGAYSNIQDGSVVHLALCTQLTRSKPGAQKSESSVVIH